MGRKKTIANPEEFSLSLGSYAKSNRLINARGKSTSLQLKVLAISLQRIEKLDDGTLQAVIPGQQLRAMLGNYNGSFYDQIKNLCVSQTHATITGWTSFVEDVDSKGKLKFKAIVLIPVASFENGQLTLTFNSAAEDLVYGLRKSYTTLPLSQVLSMSSPYSIQLYEKFKSACDLEKARTGNEGPYFIEYTLRDLKDILGLGQVKDSAGRVVQKEMLVRYDSFRSRVLDVAREEITSLTNMSVEYEPIRTGVGGKVTAIRFILRWQKVGEGAVVKESVVEGETKKETGTSFNIMEAAELFGSDFSIQDVLSVCEAAGGDMDRVRKVCDMVNRAPGVTNKTGWMIAALKNNYQESPSVAKASAKRKKKSVAKNSFSEFEQNEYNFEELEKQLLRNN